MDFEHCNQWTRLSWECQHMVKHAVYYLMPCSVRSWYVFIDYTQVRRQYSLPIQNNIIINVIVHMLFTMRTMDSMRTIKIIHKCLSHWFIAPEMNRQRRFSGDFTCSVWVMMSMVPAYLIKTAKTLGARILHSAARHKISRKITWAKIIQ